MNLNLSPPLAFMYATEGWNMVRPGRPYHGGVDLRAQVGTPVRSASSGTVIKAGTYSDTPGYAVELAHGDGMLTRYLHLSRLDVNTGQKVGAGQALGLTGFAKSPHLHFDAWVENSPAALNEYVRRFGSPTTGFTVIQTFGGRSYIKVPAEPLAPMTYQKDVLDAAAKAGVKLYSASPVRTFALLALLGVAAWGAWRYLETRRSGSPSMLPPA